MTARYFFWPSLSTVVLGFAIIGIYLLQKHFSDGEDASSSTAASRWTHFFAVCIFRWLSMLWRSWHGQWHYLSIVSCSLVAIEATFEPWTLCLRNSGCDAFGDFEQSQKYRWQLLLPWSFRGMSHRLRNNDAPAYLRVLQEGRFFPDGRTLSKNIVVWLVFSYIPIEFWDLLISNTFVASQIWFFMEHLSTCSILRQVLLALIFLFGLASLLSCRGKMENALLYGNMVQLLWN